MSFIRLKELVPSAFADNKVSTMITEVERVVGHTIPSLPAAEWAWYAVHHIENKPSSLS